MIFEEDRLCGRRALCGEIRRGMHSPSVISIEIPRYAVIAFVLSLFLHLALGWMFAASFLGERHERVREADVVEVTLSAPIELKKIARQQIVSPPDLPDVQEPPDSTLNSERNAVTEKEQIRRGDSPEAGPVVNNDVGAVAPPTARIAALRYEKELVAPPARQRRAPISPRTTEVPPRPRELDLDTRSLLASLSATPLPKTLDEVIKNSTGATNAAPPYRPFSRPSGSGAAFLGLAGSADYLPNLPDGDITLLNTKANQYAVFVRRVATLVFGQLKSSGWEYLRAADVAAIDEYTTVEAIMSPDGKLLGAILRGRSGSSRFDEVVLQASRNGVRDFNPPRGAVAEDGNIHFVFQSKSWIAGGQNPRSGAPFERRWLLLETGLL